MIDATIGILPVDHDRGSTVSLTILITLFATLFAPAVAWAQDPTGAIEGAVTDRTASAIRRARVVAINSQSGSAPRSSTSPITPTSGCRLPI